MLSVRFVFCLTGLFIGETAQENELEFHSIVRQQKLFETVQAGDNLTLHCFYEGVVDARFYWYKQDLGQKPKLISTFYKYETNGRFHGEFKNNPRFSLTTKQGQNHLKITNLSVSDSATYFCASSYLYRLEFAEGTAVNVHGSGSMDQALVLQSASETGQLRGSVTLSCLVHIGNCGEEYSVYWFKDSEESHPGFIYSHGGRNDQCERKLNLKSQSCVYNLLMKNLNVSHTGTYYCAVASCGHILFGNGTKLDLKNQDTLLTYIWSGAFMFTTIFSVLLAFTVCMINKTNSCKYSDSQAFSCFPTEDVKDYQQAENIYLAISSVLTNRSRQKDPLWSECSYFSVQKIKK